MLCVNNRLDEGVVILDDNSFPSLSFMAFNELSDVGFHGAGEYIIECRE
jgi:hypothetical protein